MQPTSVSPTDDESSPRYFGWRVVIACFLMALACWGFGLYGHSVYLAELTRLHGWSPAVIANASSAAYLFNAVLAPEISEGGQPCSRVSSAR